MKKRNRIIVVLAVAMLVCLFCLTASAAGAGDIDNDNNVSAADARLALRAAVGLETLTGDAWHVADADGNEKIEAADARLILRAAVGLETLTVTPAHHYEVWTVSKEATCAAEGEETSVCPLCGETGTRVIPKVSAHKWDTGKVTTAATCASEGVRTFTCTVCKTTKTEAIAKDAANHAGGTQIKNAVAATCAAAGYTGDICCKGCGAVITAGSGIAKLTAHTYDGGKITTAATCIATGVKTYTCSVCGATKTESVAKNAANHAGGTQIRNAVAATCQSTGFSGDVYCLGCGAKISSGAALDKTGHAFDSGVVIKAATCSATGEKTVTCTVCGAKENQTTPVDAGAHSYQWKDAGNGKCRQVCVYNASHVGAVTSHEMQAVPYTEPTCTTAGSKKCFLCTKCGGAFTTSKGDKPLTGSAYIDPTGHQRLEPKAKNPATCTTNGNIAYWKCLDCKKYFSDAKATKEITLEDTVIPASGHNMVDVVVRQPGCEDKGSTYSKCTKCDYKTSTRDISALGHDYQKTGFKNGIVPTCDKSEKFYEEYTCKRCSGKNYVAVPSDPNNHPESALHHDYGNVKEPTCTSDGYIVSNAITCTICNTVVAENVTEVIPKTEHQTRYIAKKNATCTADGKKAYYLCSECNQKFSNSAGTTVVTDSQLRIPATGHSFSGDYEKYFVKKTTCVEDGTYYWIRNCTRGCGAVQVKDASGAVNVYSASGFRTFVAAGNNLEIDRAKGHEFVFFEAHEATCTQPARTAGYGCRVCGEPKPEGGYVWDGQPNGHKYAIASSPLGTNAESFYCTVCGELREDQDLLPTYNKVVNLIKSGPMKNDFVMYFSKNAVATDYTKLTVNGIISMIPGLKNSFRDEIRQTETTFGTGESIPRIVLYIRSSGKVSNLLAKDVVSVTVKTQNGLKVSNLLDSSYGSFITSGSTTRNVDQYRQVQIGGEVVAVTVKINDETFIPQQGILGLGTNEESALEHLTGEDIRYHLEGFEEDGTNTQIENDEGLSMVSKFKLKRIDSGGNVTFYFAKDTMEPLAAVYNTSIVSAQDIEMTIKMGSLSGSISADPVMTENEQTVYLFKALTELA